MMRPSGDHARPFDTAITVLLFADPAVGGDPIQRGDLLARRIFVHAADPERAVRPDLAVVQPVGRRLLRFSASGRSARPISDRTARHGGAARRPAGRSGTGRNCRRPRENPMTRGRRVSTDSALIRLPLMSQNSSRRLAASHTGDSATPQRESQTSSKSLMSLLPILVGGPKPARHAAAIGARRAHRTAGVTVAGPPGRELSP